MSRALTNFHDFLVSVFICAPDKFPEEDYLQPHEQMTLAKAFAELKATCSIVSERVKDAEVMVVLGELLTMSEEAYLRGDDIEGAYILQEFESIIWPSAKIPEKYAPLARQCIRGRPYA